MAARGDKKRWFTKAQQGEALRKMRLNLMKKRENEIKAARIFLGKDAENLSDSEVLEKVTKEQFVYIPEESKKPILFVTYNHNCVALRKISDTPKPYYQELGYEPIQILSKEYKAMQDFKYVVLHRPIIADDFKWANQDVIALLESILYVQDKNKGRVTYFLDDCIIHAAHEQWKLIVNKCDAMVVPNTVMAEYVRKYGFEGPIEICDTHVDVKFIDEIVPSDEVWKHGKTRLLFTSVGLVGLDFIQKVFSKINRQFPDQCQVFVSGLQAGIARTKFNQFRNIDFIYNLHLPEKEYMSVFKSCDLVLNPVDASTLGLIGIPEEDRQTFLDGKSPVKWCNAGVSRKPIINGVSAPYKRVVRHPHNGLMTNKIVDWVAAIKTVIEHPERFEEMTRISRDEVELNFDTRSRAIEYVKAFTGNEVIYPEESGNGETENGEDKAA